MTEAILLNHNLLSELSAAATERETFVHGIFPRIRAAGERFHHIVRKRDMLAPRFLPTPLAQTCTATLPAAEIVAQGFSPGNAEAVVVRTIEESKRDLIGAAYAGTRCIFCNGSGFQPGSHFTGNFCKGRGWN